MGLKKENIDIVQKIKVRFLELDKRCGVLSNQINIYSTHLSKLITDSFKFDIHQFKTAQHSLEDYLDFDNPGYSYWFYRGCFCWALHFAINRYNKIPI